MRPQRWRWARTVRFRFALAYAALLAGTGIVLIALFYWYIRAAGLAQVGTRPTEATDTPTAPSIPSAPSVPSDPTNPVLSNAIFVALALLVIVAAMGVGWVIAGRLLRPLERINDTALQIGHGDLTRRVELTGPDDEFANLARVLNAMLDRLHDSLEAHRRFAANASHELRTPLATNKAMLSVALDDPGDTDFIELARRLQLTNQESIDTVEALLDLTDAQYGAVELESVDLAVLTQEALDAARDDINARAIHVETRLDTAATLGDAVLWRRLVTNLLQNAIRHNHDGGTICLRTGRADGRPFFESTNTGDILDPASIPTLAEPFARAGGRTRSGKESNRGLGLAIVASIAAAHHAAVELNARARGGLTVRVQAPASTA